ncbi:hypothetical protein LJC03_02345 [Methanobrevibacter sp. OttesenSCG-928-I08]|nr:hypothetical protein [Methanobrevibacter sp. OttesenSCG-928-I08]
MSMDLLGKCPQVKVIDYLLAHPFEEFTKQQIAVGSEISRSTLDNFINIFLKEDIININENSKYVLNKKSKIVKKLDELQEILVQKEIKKQFESFDEKNMEMYSDDELNEIFDENALDVDLNLIEKEIEIKEEYSFNHKNSKMENFDLFTIYSSFNNMELL